MKKTILAFTLALLLLIGGYFLNIYRKEKTRNISRVAENSMMESEDVQVEKNDEQKTDGEPEISDVTKFSDNFSKDGTFVDGGEMNESDIPDWWLNSGGYFYVQGGVGKTIQGELPEDDKWRLKYRDYNASETDDGYHPQNIFRLVTKSKWKNFQQECYFKINRYILSKDGGRSESNGILLFNRYQDGDNLYYTGLRVDGAVVIKKKIRGIYFVLTQEVFYPGKYDREKNPNLLPIGEWIGVKSEVQDNHDGTVSIKIYIDKNRSGDWILALTATDDGKSFGGSVLKNEGYAGIRTDFMDVEFDDYKIEEIAE